MGGKGSGKYPRKKKTATVMVYDDDAPAPINEAEIIDTAEAVQETVAFEPPPKPAASKKKPSKTPAPRSEALAFAMNSFADMMAKVPAGTAEKCGLGQAWQGVADHYMKGAASHPLAGAAFATGQFAIVVFAVKGLQKSAQQPRKETGVTKTPPKPGENLFGFDQSNGVGHA